MTHPFPSNTSPGQSAAFYDDPLIYHILHDEDTCDEVDLIMPIMRSGLKLTHGNARQLGIIEPASGSGRILHELARRGHTALGIDLSSAMATFSNAQVIKAQKSKHKPGSHQTIAGDMCGFTLPDHSFNTPFDAGLCTINSIRHLMTDAAMLKHLRLMRKLIKPTGIYIVGLELRLPEHDQPTEDVWQGSNAKLHVHQVVQYLPPDRPVATSRNEQVLSHLTITPKVGGKLKHESAEHRDSTYTLRTYNRKQWIAILAKSGWTIIACHSPNSQPTDNATFGYYLWTLAPST